MDEIQFDDDNLDTLLVFDVADTLEISVPDNNNYFGQKGGKQFSKM